MKNLSGTAKISLMLLSIFLLSTLGLWFAVTVTANPTASVDATINFNTTRIYNYDGYDRYVYDMADTMQIEIQNNDEAANNDTLVAETINVTINSSESLGSINVTLTETGANTGIFRVNIGFKTGVSDGNNNLINVTNLFEENITITYVDHAHSSGLNTSVINVSLFDENRPSLGDNTTINFGSIVAPGSNIKPVIKINNNGTWNETSLTQQITVYKHYELKYNGIDDTRHVNFMLSNITDYFVWNVTSNSTTISIYPKVYDENGTLLSSNMNGTYDVIMAGTDAKIWYIKVKNNDTATADGINITVDVYQTGLVTSNFTSSDYFLPNNFSTDMELNLTLPSVGIYGGWYNGTLKYYNDNFNTSIPIIFNVSAPEMWIETNISSPMRLMPNGTIIFKTNFWRYSQSFKIYVNNTGVKDLTTVLINLTGNLTNGTNTMPIWNLTMTPSNGSGVSVEDYGNMQLGSVPASDDSYITLSINTSECGSGAECGEGDYDTMILFSSDNGQPFTDANLTLRINVTHNLDITANSIIAYTYANSSSLTAPVITRAGVNITINFTAKYADGSYMANLDATNMTIFDDYTGDWKGYSYGNVSSFDSASSAFGVYAMNISTPAMSSGRAEFDIHNLKIQVNDGYSNVGNGTTSYNLSAPEPYATFSVSDNQLNLSSVENATLTVRFGNNGTETLYNMSVLLGINATSGLTMSKVVCNMTESNLTLNITAGELNTTLCIITLTPTAVGDYNVSTSSIGAKDQYGVDYNGTQEYYVVGVFSGTGSSSGDDEGTGGDDDVVLVADLLITTSPSAMEIMQGESNSTTVMANNTGTKAAKVKLEIELAGIQTDIVPTETTISSGKGKTFTVDITIPDDFEIGEHSTNFKAYVSTDSNIYDTKSFILTVTPTEATKQEINALHAEYTNNYNEIYSEFYNLVNEGKVSNDNKTMVESLLTQVKSDLDAAATAIAADDYLAANSLLNSVNVNIDRIRNYMDDFEAGGQGGSGAFAPLWMWIVIGLIVAGGVGFLIYMLMPPEGYSIKYGYKPPKKENFIIKLRTLKSKLTNIFPGKKAILITSKKKDDKTKKKKEVRYVAGYEKALPTDYKFSPPSGFKSSLISKMSKIRSSSKIGPYEFISQKKKKRDDE